jgi:hypothetical protein
VTNLKINGRLTIHKNGALIAGSKVKPFENKINLILSREFNEVKGKMHLHGISPNVTKTKINSINTINQNMTNMEYF